MGTHKISPFDRSFRHYLAGLLLFFCAVAGPCCLTSHAQTTAAATALDLSTPEKAVTSFAYAIAHTNWDDAVRCIQGAMPSEFSRSLSSDSKSPTLTVQMNGLTVTPKGGNDAVVSLTVAFTENGVKTAFPVRAEKLMLHKSGVYWQIVPMNPLEFNPDKNGILTSFSLLLAYPEVAMRARQKAREARASEEDEQNPLHLRPGQMARLRRNKSRPPLFVGDTREHEEAYSIYLKLKDMRTEHPKIFTKADDHFTDAEFKAVFDRSNNLRDKLITGGNVLWLPHGTLVKIIDHTLQKGTDERYAIIAKEKKTDLQIAQDPSLDNRGIGIWQVEVLSGTAKGKTVWTYDVVTTRPDLGDYIMLHALGHPADAVPIAVDEIAGHALPAAGQAASTARAAQMERLLRTKRVVQVPAGQRCFIDDVNETGDLLLIIIPTDGPLKGKRFYINPAEAVLTPP